MHRSPPEGLRLSRRRSVLGHLARPRTWTMVAALACTGVAMLPTGTRADLTPAADAAVPVGQGFTITPSDLAFILKQIKISERHSRALIPQLDPGNTIPDNPNPTTDPVYCQSMIGTGADQIPSSLLSFGLRTVRGDCNNLVPGQSHYGAADTVFPRHATPVFKAGEAAPPGFPPASPGGYASKRGSVYDTEPRTVSNLIVDQTVNNPAAVHAAGYPVRSQGNEGVFSCVGIGERQVDLRHSQRTVHDHLRRSDDRHARAQRERSDGAGGPRGTVEPRARRRHRHGLAGVEPGPPVLLVARRRPADQPRVRCDHRPLPGDRHRGCARQPGRRRHERGRDDRGCLAQRLHPLVRR